MTAQEAKKRIQEHFDEIDFLVKEFPELICLIESHAQEAIEKPVMSNANLDRLIQKIG